jgi:hypothetical protein
MATAEVETATEWDAQGKPIPSPSAAPSPSATEWDASGKPITAAPAPIVNPNKEGTYQMKGDDGQTIAVPYSQVSQPRFSQHQFVSPDEKARYQKDFTQDPARPPVGFSETARRGFSGLGKSLVQAVNPNPQNAEEAAAAAMVPLGAISERAATGLIGGAAGELTKAGEHIENFNAHPWSQSDPKEASLALGHGLAGLVPGVGPMAAESGQQIGEHLAQGDIGGAIAAPLPLAATVAAGELVPKIPGAVKTISEAPGALAQEAGDEALSQFRRNQPVEGENYTQGQHKALSGVLARGTGMGKDYFPKDVAQAVGTPLRQAAADNPTIVKAIRSGAPEDALAATQNLLEKAQDVIDKQHQAALQPVANAPFNMKPVQDAVSFPKSLEGFSPEDAAAIADLKQRLGNVNTLDGANNLRMYLNRELAPSFRKNAIAAGRSGAVDSAMSDALSKLRTEYYDQLEKASGQDFSAAKRTESSILKAQEALGNAAPQLASKEALIQEPKGIKATVADALTGARTLRGGPISGTAQLIAEKGLGETPLGQVQAGLQRFFSKLPDPTPAPTPAPGFSAAARKMLPNPQLRLPADVPANAEVGPAGQPQPPATPPQTPPGFSVSPDGTARPGAPPVATPAIITPEPDAAPLQLPAQAGPEGQGVPPPSPPTAPPLNQATAAQSTRAPLPPNPQPTPPGRTVVTPEGTAIPQRLQLPAPSPATHEWSKSAWQAANPKRDLSKATAHAKALGYKVVD